MRVDAIRKPTARAPIQEAVDAIGVRLKGGLVRNPIRVEYAGERGIDHACCRGETGEAGAVAPVFRAALEEKMVEEIGSGMVAFLRLLHYRRRLEHCVPGRFHLRLGVQTP